MTDLLRSFPGVTNVHLSTGEDLIAEVEYSRDGESLVLKRPVVPHVGFDQSNARFNVAIFPLRPYVGAIEELEVPRDKVIYTVQVGPEMDAKYRQFTSNVQLVPASAMPPVPPSIIR